MLHNIDQIPLLRAGIIEPIIRASQAIGTPLDKTLHKVGLSVNLLNNPHHLIAEIPVWNFIDAVGKLEGEPLLGIKSAMELAVIDIESIKTLLEGCINLKNLLERYIFIAPSQCNSARFTLIEEADCVWLLQKRPHLTSNYIQVEQFEIAGMIQLVQLALGKNWRPEKIHFSSGYCHHIKNSEHLNPSKIFFSQRYPGIAIPRKQLAIQLPYVEQNIITNEVPTPFTPATFQAQLKYAIMPFIGIEKLDTKLISNITGMSTRTLQRRLADNNTRYSSILEQARFQKAQNFLIETDEKLLAISIMLGYQNASTFSRAFKRWSGLSPLEYRKTFQP